MMVKGIFFAFMATALWGVVFIFPFFAPNFNALDIVIGRYIVHGTLSLILLGFFNKNFRWKKYNKYIWATAFFYALAPFILYYVLIIISIRLAGIVLPTLIISLLPISVPLLGNWLYKEFSFLVIVRPILLILLGILTINFYEFSLNTSINIPMWEKFLGVFLAISNLALWTWYAISNANFLQSHKDKIPSEEWSEIVGTCCLFIVVPMLIVLFLINPELLHITSAFTMRNELVTFAKLVIIFGITVSWTSLQLWNKASQHLPVPLLGQMIVFEPIFALMYNYFLNSKYPCMLEIIGISLVLSGVFIGIQNIRKAKKKLVLQELVVESEHVVKQEHTE